MEESDAVTDEQLALVLPSVPERRRSIVSYALAMSDSLIGGFDAADFREDVVERRFLWFHHFLVNHPDGVKHILQDNAANYVKAKIVRPLLTPALGNGLVTIEGDEWRWHRRIMTPAFNAKSVAGYAGIVTEATDAMLRAWDEDGSGSPLDLEAAMKELTLDIIARAMFSSDSGLIKDTLHRSSTRYQAEMNLSPLALIPGINRVWAHLKERRAARILKDLNALMAQLIESRKSRSSEPSSDDLLDRLLHAGDPETGRGLSASDVRDEMVTIFVAGHETTALALCWTWFLLSQHAEAEQRMWAEIDDALKGAAPTYDDIRRLPYTRMVFDEALRLFPPVHSLAWRQALERDEVCGRVVPAGAIVGIIPWVIHRHRALWEAPERFDPKRFAPERGNEHPRCAYIPFSVGPRFCIGASLALTVGVMVLAHIAQHYRLRLAQDQSVEPRGLLTLHPRNGLIVRRIRRRPQSRRSSTTDS
ncbi:MAG: cytochrome P450 [Rhodospirillales bacterium]|nr:cytochrome P450 [Rhodospirillales bacterium]